MSEFSSILDELKSKRDVLGAIPKDVGLPTEGGAWWSDDQLVIINWLEKKRD